MSVELTTLKSQNAEIIQLVRAQNQQMDRMEKRLVVLEDQGHDNHYGVIGFLGI